MNEGCHGGDNEVGVELRNISYVEFSGFSDLL